MNCKDKDGRTPLYFAAYQGHSQIVDALIEKGAQLEIKDNEGLFYSFDIFTIIVRYLGSIFKLYAREDGN